VSARTGEASASPKSKAAAVADVIGHCPG